MQNTAIDNTNTQHRVHQQILIDANGFILESTDTLFSTFPQRHRPVTEWSPFIESIFPVLLELDLDTPEIFIPRVEFESKGVTSFYDCSFLCIEWNGMQPTIVWNIFENVEDMGKLQEEQQSKNDSRLRDEV